jgi:hypothetical protein
MDSKPATVMDKAGLIAETIIVTAGKLKKSDHMRLIPNLKNQRRK